MKKLILFLLICKAQIALSQEKGLTNYLLIRVIANFDSINQRIYFVIDAENGCEAANDIYSLKKYKLTKMAVNNEAMLYHLSKDTTGSIYNYFLSTTEILNFLSHKGWNISAIYPELFTELATSKNNIGEYVSAPAVTSRPVFCFKK
jgi:hypothetical protein